MKAKQLFSWLLIASMTASLTACASTDSTESTTQQTVPTVETTVSETVSPAGPQSYTSSAKGFGGDVTVTITMDNGQITEIAVDGPDESAGIGSRAVEAMPQMILDAQSADVDNVSGATVSSTAIRTAAQAAINQANGITVSDVTMTPGTYTASAIGYGGKITVHVTVSETAIEDIVVDDSERIEMALTVPGKNSYTHYDEAPQIFQTVQTALPERILAAQSVNVDAICGATASSQGVMTAVKDALTQAGADLSLMFTAEPAQSTAVETYDADIIVVGGGTAGTMAAARATENGAKVVLIEKSGRIGGTGSISSGPACLENDMQLEVGMQFNVEGFIAEWGKQTHYTGNTSLFTKFINNTADTVDWLASKGFEWELPSNAVVNNSATNFSAYWVLWVPYHYSVNTMTVYNYFEKLVSDVDTILYETTAEELITDESGAVIGVKATKWDGTEVIVNAKSVIVSTGGIAGSDELMEKYNGGKDYLILGLTQNTGDGLRMMTEVGAAEKNIGGACTHVVGLKNVPQGFDDYDTAIPYTLAISATMLKVNQQGTRFMDENGMKLSLTQACNTMFAQGDYYWTLVSEKQLAELKESGLAGTGITSTPGGTSFTYEPLPIDYAMTNIETVLDAGVETGMCVKADSLEELSAFMDTQYDILSYNVSLYNEYCEAGEDLLFHKDATLLDTVGEENQTWYAIKTYPSIYSALGGVATDEFMRVLDTDGQIIPGLYAAGIDAIGNILDGVAYTDLMGIAVGWGFNSGKFAADHASAALK